MTPFFVIPAFICHSQLCLSFPTLSVIPNLIGNLGKMANYYVYILASKKNGTLYCGVTNDLIRRVYEHKNGLVDGFTKKYKIHSLVYYEICNSAEAAIEREKDIKRWYRKWKLELIEKENPLWEDLYERLVK